MFKLFPVQVFFKYNKHISCVEWRTLYQSKLIEWKYERLLPFPVEFVIQLSSDITIYVVHSSVTSNYPSWAWQWILKLHPIYFKIITRRFCRIVNVARWFWRKCPWPLSSGEPVHPHVRCLPDPDSSYSACFWQ